MYRPQLLLPVVFCGAQLAFFSPISAAKTKVEIGRIAKSITVRIETIGFENQGSGVILQKQGDVYTALTAAHVLAQGTKFKIHTPDGKVYESISVRKANTSIDLAVVKFRSQQTYQVATIGASNTLESGSEVYVAGFPAATRTIDDGVFNFTKGDITGNASKPNSKGYSLIYNCITLPGMSGGPILNEAGQLVAIHGQGDRDSNEQKTGFNLGITIERFGLIAKSLEATSGGGAIAPVSVSSQLKPADFLLSGRDKSQAGNYQGALNDYNQAIQLDPKYASAYNSRGFLKENQLGDIAGALADYNQAIQVDPKFEVALNNRGYLKLNKQKDVQGALADYNKAIAINPKYYVAYNNRGSLKENHLNDSRAALADYNQALSLNPNYAVAYNNRGLLKVNRLNDVNGALADYNLAIQLNPRYAIAYFNRGILKKDQLNDYKGALADYNLAIQSDAKYANAYNSRGVLRKDKLKDYRGAMADYTRAIELNPKFSNPYNNRGVIKVDIFKDYPGGLADYSKAIELNPQFALAYYNRALVKKNKLNDRSGAIRDFRQAANLFKQQGKKSNLQETLNELVNMGVSPE
jgi:tetratricopeptide (TPR) repeat protein